MVLNLFSLITSYGNYLYYILFASFIFIGFIKKQRKLLKVGLIYLVVQLIASGLITGGLKIIVGRPRPGYGFEHQFFTNRNAFKSFPSWHATDAFGSAGVLWAAFPSLPLSIISFFYSFLIGLSRIFVGVHYFHDVITGMAIGFLTGLLITYKKLSK